MEIDPINQDKVDELNNITVFEKKNGIANSSQAEQVLMENLKILEGRIKSNFKEKKSENLIKIILKWNKDAGNTIDEINVRQTALYKGLDIEELMEGLEYIEKLCDPFSENIIALSGLIEKMKQVSKMFKKGKYDDEVEQALSSRKGRKVLLDSNIDSIVTNIGGAASQGADVMCALNEVVNSNDSKRFEDGTLRKDKDGKIIKGPNYVQPNLDNFIKN